MQSAPMANAFSSTRRTMDREHPSQLSSTGWPLSSRSEVGCMKGASNSSVTRLLQAWTTGEKGAQEKLWPIVFAELKRLARRRMNQERADHTLESGALVNEAYLRLVDWKNAKWE